MAIDKYLDKIDDMLEEAISLPLSGGKRMVDAEKIRDLLDAIRLNLPQEIKEAKAVVADRTAILDAARAESDEIIRKAETRARQLIGEQEIMKAAKAESAELLAESQRKSKEMERAALDFSENALKKSEDALLLVFNEVKTTRLALRGKVKK
ncbi:MAG: ATPase [Oscillospiraceae bacterium]|nr:ATPase [Oscillospiraceae bacterium]